MWSYYCHCSTQNVFPHEAADVKLKLRSAIQAIPRESCREVQSRVWETSDKIYAIDMLLRQSASSAVYIKCMIRRMEGSNESCLPWVHG